jgi:hypothetical protein
MALPFVPARVEERRYLLGQQIESCYIRRLAIIAGKTSDGEIPGHGKPVVFSRKNMVDLVLKAIEFLRHLAILAAKSRSPPNQFFKIAIHSRVRFLRRRQAELSLDAAALSISIMPARSRPVHSF